MRRFVVLTLLAISAACGSEAAPVTPPPTGGGTADVYTPGNVFSPFSTTIPVGGSVRFNIAGDPHNVIFKRIAGAPSDVNVVSNQVVTRTFTSAGTYPFDCTVHPGMSGQVVVQ